MSEEPVIRIGFRWADAPAMTDEAIAGLVGQVADLSLLGEPLYKVLVTAARRVDDEWMGPGVWMEVERVRPPAWPGSGTVVRSARLRKLDADGQPVGEWIDLEGAT